MNQKVEDLARTLVQSGIAASESEAKRMAEEMVSTETKVQGDFDEKKEKETMWGKSPRSPGKENQGQLNQSNSNPRPLDTEVKVNPVDGTPIVPTEEQKPRDNQVKPENPHMTPEEYSAAQLNVAKSTSELIEEEQMNEEAKVPVEITQEKPTETTTANETPAEPGKEETKDSTLEKANQEVETEAQEKPTETAGEDLDIPKPEDPVEAPVEEQKTEEAAKEAPSQETVEEQKKDLPELNPLDQEPKAEAPAQTAEPTPETQPAVETEAQEKPKMTPEEYTAGNNQSVGSDGKPLPQTKTPDRPVLTDEEKAKMEESKVDLTKIFKV